MRSGMTRVRSELSFPKHQISAGPNYDWISALDSQVHNCVSFQYPTEHMFYESSRDDPVSATHGTLPIQIRPSTGSGSLPAIESVLVLQPHLLI